MPHKLSLLCSPELLVKMRQAKLVSSALIGAGGDAAA